VGVTVDVLDSLIDGVTVGEGVRLAPGVPVTEAELLIVDVVVDELD
jgi:hypothetical protein